MSEILASAEMLDLSALVLHYHGYHADHLKFQVLQKVLSWKAFPCCLKKSSLDCFGSFPSVSSFFLQHQGFVWHTHLNTFYYHPFCTFLIYRLKRKIGPKFSENKNTLQDFWISLRPKCQHSYILELKRVLKKNSRSSLFITILFLFFKNFKIESIKNKGIILNCSIQRAHHTNPVALS